MKPLPMIVYMKAVDKDFYVVLLVFQQNVI